MATTLLEGAASAPSAAEHPGHDEDPEGFLHPWAREMYRRGFSFNGGERTKVFLGDGRELIDVSDVSNADSPLDGRALVAADLDDDGDVDLFVHNIQRERHHLYRCEVDPAEGRSFLSIDLARAEHVEPIGATVVVRPVGGSRATAQVASRGSGYASCQPARLLFGLGDARAAEVHVRWPGGAFESFGEVPAGARVVLREGAGEATQRPRSHSSRLVAPLPPGLKLAPGARVPRLSLEGVDGEVTVLDPEALTADGPVTLELWASYCRPCVEDLPRLVGRAAAGERIVAVSVDVPKEREKARLILARHGVSVPTYFLSMDDEANEGGFDRVIDLMRLPIPTALELLPGGVLGEVRSGAR